MLRRQSTWIQYNEPEKHLNAWTDRLIADFPAACAGRILGLSPVDHSFMERLRERGCKAQTLHPEHDLDITDPLAGTETIQAHLNPERAHSLRRARGLTSVLAARYLLEHIHDMDLFMGFVDILLEEGGLLVLEVPDCEAAIAQGDAAMLWDQHTAYFTAATLRHCLTIRGFSLEGAGLGIESRERGLLAVARRTGKGTSSAVNPSKVAEARDFPFRAAERSRKIGAFLEHRQAATQSRKPAFLFGANHITAAFLFFACPSHHLAGLIDDHPEKVGGFCSAFSRVIQPSSSLKGENSLILHGLSQESAIKVQARLKNFLGGESEFYSILAGQSDAIPL